MSERETTAILQFAHEPWFHRVCKIEAKSAIPTEPVGETWASHRKGVLGMMRLEAAPS
jgi:hypothetical protein